MKRRLLLSGLLISALAVYATDAPTFSEVHGYKDTTFSLSLSCATTGASIYYTTDCTTPSSENGELYVGPIDISHTTIIRAIAIDENGKSSVTTASTYIFPSDVVHQYKPKGYPSMWGPYCSISGTAKADYDMDPELCDSERDVANVICGLKSLPVISLVADPDFLFSHERDEEKGGIYIYTGGDSSSTGNGYGDGWLRAASVELWESDKTLDSYWSDHNPEDGFQVNCAIKIHGNASRQAEKTPKHSFRMKMKSDYGPKKLNYRLFGEEGGKKFNQIVIRAGFGNSWLHWLPAQQTQAMYTRDAWAKRVMSRLGHHASGTRYAHLFINGMYWGVYNPTERIDSDFCELHLGGDEKEYDVVRYDKDILEAVDGSVDDYLRLLDGIDHCADYAVYQSLRGYDTAGNALSDGDVLFDSANFIDYMLVNYYGGNTDWDHHNWAAVHRRGSSEGFKWLPWDSELVLQGVNDNVTGIKNAMCPTYIFRTLIDGSQAFRYQFVDRAYSALCEEYGFLQPDSVQAIWEELTAEISDAMYAEAARWGDYRRDVHPYVSAGALYTKPSHFDPQCQYMRDKYFPQRSAKVLQQLQKAGFWLPVVDVPSLCVDNLSQRSYQVILNPNQQVSLKGSYAVYYTLDGTDPVAFTDNGTVKLSSTAQRASGNIDVVSDCIVKARVRSGTKSFGPLLERSIILGQEDGIISVAIDNSNDNSTLYNILGQPVSNPTTGIYILNNKLIIKK